MENNLFCPNCGKQACEISRANLDENDVYTLHVDTFEEDEEFLDFNDEPMKNLINSEYCNNLEAVVCSECGFGFFKSV